MEPQPYNPQPLPQGLPYLPELPPIKTSPKETEPQQPETPKPTGYSLSRMMLSMFLGIIIGIAIMAVYISTTQQEIDNEQAFNYGGEYTISLITNQSIQCNQIPINYSGYAFTLYPLECSELNQGGGE